MIILKGAQQTFIAATLAVTAGCTQVAASEPPTEPQFQTVLPGDPGIDTARLADHTIRYVKPGGQMIVLVERETVDGREFINTKVWFNVDDTEPNPDTIRHDAETMAFYSRTFGDPEVYVIDVAFQEGRFVGSLTPGPDSGYSPVDYDKAYPHEGFEPAIIFNPIRTLPLVEGYTASIPVFDLNNGSQMFWSNIEVIGREMIEVNGQTYDTLKVVSNGVRRKILWFTDDLPYPVQMETEGSPMKWKISAD